MKIVFSKCHRLGEGEDSVGEICMETIKQSVQTQVIPLTVSDRVRPLHTEYMNLAVHSFLYEPCCTQLSI